ncbi:MAG: hypothetical protein QE273_15830 [Verrucomicrobiales bacterium]|nr:hypothetical protein [Verrucomicrobiales bacterium]
MIEQLKHAPFSFWLHLLLLTVLIVEGTRKWHAPWAKPALVIYGTVIFWYTGDFLLSTPVDYQRFSDEVVRMAFFQVCLFLVCFRVMLVWFSRRFCDKPLRLRKQQTGSSATNLQKEFPPAILLNALIVLILVWLGLFAFGVSLNPPLWKAIIWPPLHPEKIGMYPLVGVGGGFSFIYNALGYIHVLICAMFGVIAVMARGPVRWVAIGMVLLTWPYFLFDRTRNRMLALLLPSSGAFFLLGRSKIWVKIAVGVALFLGVGVWFTKVAEYRTQYDLTSFLESNTDEEDEDAPARRKMGREGQDMLKELCWINTFIESGRYRPTMGGRYFAEIVNPIPRSIWPGKPMVGIDYAIARGFGGSRGGAGVFASVSTGMIGQGCVNFGRFFGVIAAALLFALWAGFLARLWCQSDSPFRLSLFLIGLGLTLNTGRDLTLLVLFPFLFGYLGILFYEKLLGGRNPRLPIRSLDSPPSSR